MIGYRITSSTVDKISFKVPRLHKDHFQDDIFCPTVDMENPHLSADEWINGKAASLKWIDLRPPGMPLCKIR
jgi:coronin-7